MILQELSQYLQKYTPPIDIFPLHNGLLSAPKFIAAVNPPLE